MPLYSQCVGRANVIAAFVYLAATKTNPTYWGRYSRAHPLKTNLIRDYGRCDCRRCLSLVVSVYVASGILSVLLPAVYGVSAAGRSRVVVAVGLRVVRVNYLSLVLILVLLGKHPNRYQ